MHKILLTVCLLLVTACSSQKESTPTELSQESLQSSSGLISNPDLGSAESSGSDATITLTIKTNSSTLRSENVVLASGAQGFSLLTSSCPNINNSRTCTVRVKFTVGSKENGTYSDAVVIGDLSVPVSTVLNKPVPVNDTSGITVVEGSSEVSTLSFGTLANSGTVLKTLIIKDSTKKVKDVVTISSSTSDYTVFTTSCTAATVNSSAGCTIRVQISGSGKPAGNINANLLIGSKSLPMSATIQGATVIVGVADLHLLVDDVEVSSKDFGSIATGNKASAVIKIKNQGSGASSANTLAVSGSAYSATSSTCTSVIQAGSACQLNLNLNAINLVGSQSGSLSYGGKTLSLQALITGSCSADKHAESGVCLSNIISESIENGTRSKTYSVASSTWGNWNYRCNSGYAVSGETCAVSTPPNNSSGFVLVNLNLAPDSECMINFATSGISMNFYGSSGFNSKAECETSHSFTWKMLTRPTRFVCEVKPNQTVPITQQECTGGIAGVWAEGKDKGSQPVLDSIFKFGNYFYVFSNYTTNPDGSEGISTFSKLNLNGPTPVITQMLDELGLNFSTVANKAVPFNGKMYAGFGSGGEEIAYGYFDSTGIHYTEREIDDGAKAANENSGTTTGHLFQSSDRGIKASSNGQDFIDIFPSDFATSDNGILFSIEQIYTKDYLYFQTSKSITGGMILYSLWRTDGTPEGTVQLIQATKNGYGGMKPFVIDFENNKIGFFNDFASSDGSVEPFSSRESPFQLWATSGLPLSTIKIMEIAKGSQDGGLFDGGQPTYLSSNGQAYVGLKANADNLHLYRTNGQVGGTVDLMSNYVNGENLKEMMGIVNGVPYLTVQSDARGSEIYKVQGNSVVLDKETIAGPDSINIYVGNRREVFTYGTKIYFISEQSDLSPDRKVYEYNTVSKVLQELILPSTISPVDEGYLVDDKLFFYANSSVHGEELLYLQLSQ